MLKRKTRDFKSIESHISDVKKVELGSLRVDIDKKLFKKFKKKCLDEDITIRAAIEKIIQDFLGEKTD